MRVKSVVVILCFSALMILGFQAIAPLGRAMALTATVDIEPNTLNSHMNGQWITVRVGLPSGYSVNDIDQSTILLEGLFSAEWSKIDGKILMVKIDASSVTDYLLEKLYHMGVNRSSVELTITGQLKDGTLFSGSDTITVINPPFAEQALASR